MSWLLFLDESGHDHKTMPYEIHGGFAVHASKLWPLISSVRDLERSMFGTHLHQCGSELKGCRLLARDRFRWRKQDPPMDGATRRAHARRFLNDPKQGHTPRRDNFTGFGQACIAMAEQAIDLLRRQDAKVFAVAIPHVQTPVDIRDELLRKDLVFLLERYFYFLESQREMGLIVMDGCDKQADRKLVRRMERYFSESAIGRQRTNWIVPVPLFVESDMAYGIQVADLCIYCLNWGWRLRNMTEATREEIVPFVRLLEKVFRHGDGYRDGKVCQTHGTAYVPDPYTAR